MQLYIYLCVCVCVRVRICLCVCHGGHSVDHHLSYNRHTLIPLPLCPPAILHPAANRLSSRVSDWLWAAELGFNWLRVGRGWWRSRERGKRRREMLCEDVNGHLAPSASCKKMIVDAPTGHWHQPNRRELRKTGLYLDDDIGLLRIFVRFLFLWALEYQRFSSPGFFIYVDWIYLAVAMDWGFAACGVHRVV